MMNATATAIILEFQKDVGIAVKYAGDGPGIVAKMEVMGQEFLEQHFTDAEGNPRTDLDGLTMTDVWNAKELIKTILAPLTVPANLQLLVKVSGGRL